jgi:hypothetical protein
MAVAQIQSVVMIEVRVTRKTRKSIYHIECSSDHDCRIDSTQRAQLELVT